MRERSPCTVTHTHIHTGACTEEHAHTQTHTHGRMEREWMGLCVRSRGRWGDVGPVTSKVLGHSPPPPPAVACFPLLLTPSLRRNVADADDVTSFLRSPSFCSSTGTGPREGGIERERFDLLHPSSLYDNNIRVSRLTKSATTAPQCLPSPRPPI